MTARFRAILIFEGLETGDRRKIALGALGTRALPLTLMGMTVNPEFGGHGLAEVVGRIDTAERVDFTGEVDASNGRTWGEQAGGQVFAWVGEGEFDDRTEAADVEQLVRDGHLRGISADLAEVTSELEVLEEDEDGWPTDWLDTVTEANIAAATVCNIPAFRGCTIELLEDDAADDSDTTSDVDVDVDDDDDDEATESGTEEADVEAIAAAGDPWLPAFRIVNDGPGCEPCTTDPTTAAVTASGGPLHPPATWFADPALDGPTPLTVTDDGRVYGHLATWGTCHTSFSGQCVTPPRSATDYALFQLGAVRTAEGTDVPVGHITMGTGHADLRASLRTAAEHYDNTGTVLVDVAAGEDEHGIWVSGALRPGVTEEQVRTLRAASLSGDWRSYGGRLELVAALAVNVPGFPVQRARAVAASGVPQALVAAGAQASPSLGKTTVVDVDTAVTAAVQAATAPLLGIAKREYLRAIRGDR